MRDLLQDLLKARVPPEGWSWFEKALQATAAPVNSNVLLGYYTGASRRLGKRALLLDEGEQERSRALDPTLALDRWGADEAGRAVLLLSAAHLPPAEYRDLAQGCYEQGDAREQQSWLRALSLLPECERFLETAIDACRTNIIELFESIACENPYPSLYFPELNFNQLVLKCLFNGIAVARIVGLEGRLNAELSRMADDYASEREAAGREVPTDIWLVLAPHVAPEGIPRVYRYLGHENPEHRYWAALGLGLAGDAAHRAPLERQREAESEARVRQAIASSLARLA